MKKKINVTANDVDVTVEIEGDEEAVLDAYESLEDQLFRGISVGVLGSALSRE